LQVFIGDLKNDVLKVIEKLNEFQKYQIKYAINKYISNLAIHYTDWTIDQLNDSATNLTGELSIPKETSFYKFSKNILDLKTSTDYFINLLNIDLKPTNIEIGHIESKGLIKLTTKNQLVSSRSIDGIDATTLLQNKKDIKPVLKLINKINNEFMIPNDLVQEINKYTSINHLKDFISIEKYLSLNSEKYIPSKGEKAILAIQHKVISKTNNTHFILDEPELSLSNIYINKDIVPLINKLAYEGKTIIVATHNPNLAVRTRPINTLLKQTDNNVYRTYIGNMFSNTLKNIIDIKDIKSWKDESIKHLEGGKDAFNERGYYYENNQVLY